LIDADNDTVVIPGRKELSHSVTCLVVNESFIIAGSSSGYIQIWDVRVRIL
jgi:hypothetical protein